MSGCWVFGYGSLVDHESFGATLGRPFRPGVDFFPAVLDGYGRRWNYGLIHSVGRAIDGGGPAADRTIVALGLELDPAGSVNGAIGWVAEGEIAALDRRERHYDRVDVAALTTVAAPDARVLGDGIVTYVPRPEAIRHYERARDRGAAAIEQRYWDLVDRAFRELGPGEHERYRATTPSPDVPVLELVRVATGTPS